MKTRKILAILATSLLALAVVACGDAEQTAPAAADGANNGGGKTDTPGNNAPATEQCEDREKDNLNASQRTWIPTAIRWACADVEGVNTVGNDDRGQEYCEYFVLVQTPPNDGSDALGETVLLGHHDTGLGLELSDDQSDWLEDNPDTVVGQCMFTSWHNGTDGVQGGWEECARGETCPNVLGREVDKDTFQMRVGFNSNPAASALVNDCVNKTARGEYRTGDLESAEDPLNRDFYRACILTSELYGTQWRRSDPAVCASAMRLVECGCGIEGVTDLGKALVPPQPVDGKITLWGFPLGTWSGASDLPVGCKYVAGPEGTSQTLVSCDLKASDLLSSAGDPKERCRQRYAGDVVVHVPVPQGAITCNPPADGPYAGTCSDMPWIVENQIAD